MFVQLLPGMGINRREEITIMKKKIIVASILAVIASAITIAAIANPEDPFRSIRNIINKTPSLMSADDGASIIKSKYPNLSSNLEFKYAASIPDKTDELLQYASDEAEISLNAKEKTVEMLQFKQVEDSKSASIDLEEAKEIAITAVSEYRPDIDLSTMMQTVAELHNYGSFCRYRILWYEIKDSIYTGTRITVELNGEGDLKMISAHRNSESAKIDKKAMKISETQAGDIALNHISTRMSQELYKTVQIDESTMRAQGSTIYWVVNLSTHTDDTKQRKSSYSVIIDAQTGEVIDKEQSV